MNLLSKIIQDHMRSYNTEVGAAHLVVFEQPVMVFNVFRYALRENIFPEFSSFKRINSLVISQSNYTED